MTLALVTTDIVGSTALVCRLGDAGFHQLMELHNEVLVASLDLHGGELVRDQGDGMLVAFVSAVDALAWTVDAQRIVPDTVGVQIRIGAHFGPVRIGRPGYVGKALHVLARITALADGGEILASKRFVDAAGLGCVGETKTVQLRGLDESTELVSMVDLVALSS